LLHSDEDLKREGQNGSDNIGAKGESEAIPHGPIVSENCGPSAAPFDPL
jgi:hypothetical protein